MDVRTTSLAMFPDTCERQVSMSEGYVLFHPFSSAQTDIV
jgi:hypothetical protein